ncbi:MAG TPA: DUF4956 domain-containing protein [Bacteroidetes bacterium]|nr:DUF4956 domain-containing protein [Bacteroidota bacterium]
MFDFSSLQYNTENPTFISVLFTVLFSLVLGTMIAFTYEKTSRAVGRPNHFLQALVLITIVAATILQAIGDSVARGLGMLGALSIIRFRTTVKDPRNIVFMFAAIASGIACGVFGFTIAIVGTAGFCLTAFLLRLSSFSQKEKLIGTLRLELPQECASFSELEKQLSLFCESYVLEYYKVFISEKKSHLLLYEYQLKLKYKARAGELAKGLKGLPEIKVVSLNFRNQILDNI